MGERENEEREGEPTGRAEKPEGLLLGLFVVVTSVYNTAEREQKRREPPPPSPPFISFWARGRRGARIREREREHVAWPSPVVWGT